ncbi:MAG: AraC family transcriptional regulator [Chitinophagaceae bacterium]|nr:MAG: AraC family transcriptional regulator [Chitinophagaceae bacterium]
MCKSNAVMSTLYITDIGYYPKARHHYRERKHGADQHILIYCSKGGGRVEIRDTVYQVEAEEFIFIPAKTPHAYQANDDDPWTIHWVHFTGSVAASILETQQKQGSGHKGTIRNSEKIVNLFTEMYDLLERGYSTDNLLYTNMCFWHFLTLFIFNDKFSSPGHQPEKDPSDLAIDFMGKKIDQVLSLEEIAAQVNFSASHFSYIFKKKTGYAPMEYFNHLKVQKACQYLLFTSLRVKEIAQNLGIEDPYYFSRLFTKVMGISPALYREKRSH